MLLDYLENVYIFKSNNCLNFMGGAATDAHFEVTLKSKKVFLAICLKTYTLMLLKYIQNIYILKGNNCLHFDRNRIR